MIRSIDFSPDSRRLASTGADDSVKLWDVVNGTVVHEFGPGGWGFDVKFSPDGKHLASSTLKANTHLLGGAFNAYTSISVEVLVA